LGIAYCVLCAVTPIYASHPAQYEIVSIRTAGNRLISSAEILSRARSRVGQSFDEATTAEDAKRIGELTGVEYCYYNTAVVDDKIQLTFVVVERNVVRKIVFVGNRRVKTKKLLKKLDFKIGDYLDIIQAGTGREMLTNFYCKKGFAFAKVTLEEEKLSVGQVVYTIDEGPRVKVDSVTFRGNSFFGRATTTRNNWPRTWKSCKTSIINVVFSMPR